MDSAFVLRSLRMAAGLTLLVFVLGAYYVKPAWALGVTLGSVWSIANLYLIKVLVERLVTKRKQAIGPTAVLALVKFPLLYAAGFLVLSWDLYSVGAPLWGFGIPFLVMVLKAAGRMTLGIEGADRGRRPAGAGLKR